MVDQARLRMGYALKDLTRLTKGDLTLAKMAQVIICADTLLSSASLIYDALYDANNSQGHIGRRPKRPIAKGQLVP